MKAKRKDLLELWRLINSHMGVKYNIKFSYFLAKNRRKIQSEIEAINDSIKPSEAYKIYDTERANIANRFSDKDLDGKPIIVDSNYMITEESAGFNKELNNLKEEYKKIIDERDKQFNEYNKMLDEEVEFNGHIIKISEMPDQLDAEFLGTLMDVNLIDE